MVVAMQAAARCGAETRKGTKCAAPAIRGRVRCRMHGGSRKSGAKQGNRNALKHGFYTAEIQAGLRYLRKLSRDGGKKPNKRSQAALTELLLPAPVLRLSCRCLFTIERTVEIMVLPLRR